MTTVYLRNVGTAEDDCWVVCAKGDPGAVTFTSESSAWTEMWRKPFEETNPDHKAEVATAFSEGDSA